MKRDVYILALLAAAAAWLAASTAAVGQTPAPMLQPASPARASQRSAASQSSTGGLHRGPAAPAKAQASDGYVQALEKHLRGKYNDALAAYDALLAQQNTEDRTARLLYGKAMCYAGLGQHQKAVETLTKISSSLPPADPGAPGLPAGPRCSWSIGAGALVRAAEICDVELNDTQQATKLYEDVSARRQGSHAAADALLGLARLQEQAGQFDEALKTYDLVMAETRSWSRPRLNGIEGRRAGNRIWVAERLADRRKQFLIDNSDTERRPLAMYVRAERLLGRNQTRNQALLDLIRLAGLYPDSALADDAFVQMVRIHLLKGDEAAARLVFERLLKSLPRRLSVEPVRSIALRAAGWLLQEADRELAGEAEVFPELAGYKAGENLALRRAADSAAWRLEFASKGDGEAPRHLELLISVECAARGRLLTHRGLGLRIETRMETSSDMLASEARRTVDGVVRVLELLDKAATVPPENPPPVSASGAGRSEPVGGGNGA